MDGNPHLIQPPSPSHHPHALPLVLIHDGGGTTFAYHCLPTLPRAVYGISNPRFNTGGKFEGGVPEMGRLYAAMIRSLVASAEFPRRRSRAALSGGGDGEKGGSGWGGGAGGVEILLGGWSLGGTLSLEVSKHLGPMVKGIIMADTPYPARNPGQVHLSLPPLGPNATKSQRLARECITNAPSLLRGWEVPANEVPMVLIRATENFPVRDGQGSYVDRCRQDEKLGWGEDPRLRRVIDVPGHHFDIFEFHRIDGTAVAIGDACLELERK